MLSKQDKVLLWADELPFNQIEIQVGALRETKRIHIKIDGAKDLSFEPDTTAMRYAYINLNKLDRTFTVYYDHILEFFFRNKDHIPAFLQLLQTKWKGDWTNKEEEAG